LIKVQRYGVHNPATEKPMSKPQTTVVRGIRVTPEGWALFESFRKDLERTLPFGRVPLHMAFDIAVGSATVALRDGPLPTLPKHYRTPADGQT
jgi:hypothetical protein